MHSAAVLAGRGGLSSVLPAALSCAPSLHRACPVRAMHAVHAPRAVCHAQAGVAVKTLTQQGQPALGAHQPSSAAAANTPLKEAPEVWDPKALEATFHVALQERLWRAVESWGLQRAFIESCLPEDLRSNGLGPDILCAICYPFLMEVCVCVWLCVWL